LKKGGCLIRIVKSFFVLILVYETLLGGEAYSLKELIDLSLKNSPNINISKQDIEVAISRRDFAASDAKFQAGIEANIGADGFKYKDYDYESDFMLNGSFYASLLLYDFDVTKNRIKSLNEDINTSTYLLSQTIQDKVYEVKSNYYKLLKAKRVAKVMKESLKLSKEQEHRAKRFFEQGIRTIVDVTNAKVQRVSSQMEVVKSNNSIKYQKNSLQKTIGLSDNNWEVKENELDFDTIMNNLPAFESDIGKLNTIALEKRPVVMSAKQRVASAKSYLQSVSKENYPIFVANGKYNGAYVDEFEASVAEQSFVAGVGFKWDMLNGGRVESKIKEARAKLMKEILRKSDIEQAVKKEVKDSVIRAQNAKSSLEYSKELVELTNQQLEQVKKSYENGLVDYLKYQDALLNYTTSREQFVNSYYDYLIAIAMIKHAVGI